MRSLLSLLGLVLGFNALAQTPSWTEKVQFNGDFRFRHEYTSKTKQADESARQQERFRLRLGLQGQVNEKVRLKARVGGSDGQSPISNNTTMTDNAQKKGFYIDQAMIEWKMCDEATLNLGKQDNPFRQINPSQIIYDSDYMPEGVSVLSQTPELPIYVNVGAFVIQERSAPSTANTTEPDSWLKAAMVGYKKSSTEGFGWNVALGYHEFSNIYNKAALTPGFSGNSNAGAKYLEDYEVGEILADLRYISGGLAYGAYVDAIQNMTIGDDNQALQAGLTLQTLNDKAKPVWTFGYAYITQAKDATVSALNNSDSANGVDGNLSHMFQVGKVLGENVSANLTYYHAKLENSGNSYWSDKGLADIMFNF